MNRVEKIIDHAEQHCRTHGSRLTAKRKQVLSGLLKSKKALSAYELIDLCKSEYGETMPATSIYRILDFLQTEHLVHKLRLANKYVACEHITCNHDHDVSQFLICSQCQKVKEISISKATTAELQESVGHAGFHLVSPQLEIDCVCDSCLNHAA